MNKLHLKNLQRSNTAKSVYQVSCIVKRKRTKRRSTWKCFDGTVVAFTQMTDGHLRNAIAMLQRDGAHYQAHKLKLLKAERERRFLLQANSTRQATRSMRVKQ